MIHRLRLRNWRSYEDLDLLLDPGTTFVVAPNGVGENIARVRPRLGCVRGSIVASTQRPAYELELKGRRSRSSSTSPTDADSASAGLQSGVVPPR